MKRIWLRDARRKKRLTQAQLSAALGKPQNFISRLERGHNVDPTIGEVIALAKALDVEPLALRFGKRDERRAA